MGRIKGITVRLYEKTQTGVDGFNRPIYKETPVDVDNVLVAPTSSTDIINTTDLTGKTAVYTLAIPKGDSHNWMDAKVEFFGEMWQTFGFPIMGIDALVPLEWNMKVMVERYE